MRVTFKVPLPTMLARMFASGDVIPLDSQPFPLGAGHWPNVPNGAQASGVAETLADVED